MADRLRTAESLSVVAPLDQPVIGVILQQDGQDVVRHFADEAAADAVIGDDATADTLALAGAWSDLDWQDMAAALDQIRHETLPTPPIEL